MCDEDYIKAKAIKLERRSDQNGCLDDESLVNVYARELIAASTMTTVKNKPMTGICSPLDRPTGNCTGSQKQHSNSLITSAAKSRSHFKQGESSGVPNSLCKRTLQPAGFKTDNFDTEDMSRQMNDHIFTNNDSVTAKVAETSPTYLEIPERKHSDVAAFDMHLAEVKELPFNDFMSLDDALTKIITCTNYFSEIPPGKKDNCYFLFDNTLNKRRREAKLKRVFQDDVGTWTSCRQTYSYYLKTCGTYKYLYKPAKQNGAFCALRKKEYVPLTPQPSAEEVIKVGRYYAKLKSNASFQKRITWIEADQPGSSDACLIEYKGKERESLFSSNRNT